MLAAMLAMLLAPEFSHRAGSLYMLPLSEGANSRQTGRGGRMQSENGRCAGCSSAWRGGTLPAPRPAQSRARRPAARASSSLATVSRCTTSGPSARRSVRAPAHMWARGVTSDTPAAPCVCGGGGGGGRRRRVWRRLAGRRPSLPGAGKRRHARPAASADPVAAEQPPLNACHPAQPPSQARPTHHPLGSRGPAPAARRRAPAPSPPRSGPAPPCCPAGPARARPPAPPGWGGVGRGGKEGRCV